MRKPEEIIESMRNSLELTCLKAINMMRNKGDYIGAKRFAGILRWNKLIDKGDVNNFLWPSGEFGGIMVVGINPSEKSNLGDIWEDRFGKDFLRYLGEAGIDHTKLWMTNLWKSPTPENRPLNEIEIKKGKEILEAEIDWVDPVIILLMGQQVYNEYGLPESFCKSTFKGIPIYSIPHISYLSRIRDPNLEKKFIRVLKQINDKKRLR